LEKIGSNNLKVTWDGVKKMIGLQKTQNKPVQLPMYKNDSILTAAKLACWCRWRRTENGFFHDFL